MDEKNLNNPPFNDYLGFGKNENALSKALNLGEKFRNEENYASAIKHFDYVIINDFTNKFMFAYIYKALSYYGMKEYNSSIDVCSEAINIGAKKFKDSENEEIAKEMAILHETRSRSSIEVKEIEKAIEDLIKYINYFPTDAHGRLGNLLFEQERYEDALDYFENMAMMFPDNGRNRFKMGLCYMQMNQKDKAIGQFAISNNQGYEHAYEYFAKLTNG